MDLPQDISDELSKLNLQQRWIVLQGLNRKLWHLDRTGRLSYKYEVCPVCNDMGSTQESQKCDGCYIQLTCKRPFIAGFRNDQDRGEEYFRKVYEFMMDDEHRKNAIVIGGDWDTNNGRESKIARMIAESLDADLFNGGSVDDLIAINIKQYQLVVWMPNVPNNEEKVYPSKNTGAVLVVSKVMREGYTSADAASRIFKMHGNAVIEIYKGNDKMSFRLADALNNAWAETTDIKELCSGINKLYKWTNGSVRLPTIRGIWNIDPEVPPDMEKLIALVREVADKVEIEMGGRYFGNLSTRCMKMFPSAIIENGPVVSAFVSPRDIDKHRIEASDMVFAWADQYSKPVFYIGDRKPSVDTAIQLVLYKQFKNLKFMIHGHAIIEGAPITNNYWPCGDLREVNCVAPMIAEIGEGVINLKNHGFLMFANSIEALDKIVKSSVFKNRL